MALNIIGVEGDKVYVSGYVQLNQVGQDLEVTGFDIQNNDTITHEIDPVLMASIPGTGYGKLLMYIYKKAKELLCPECGNKTDPE